jgi:propanol-preferring alcohol dehydrogenase
MKAIQLIQPGLPLELRDVPVPRGNPEDVLVRVKAAGICHSDCHYRAGRSRVYPLPMTLGHEVAGVIEEASLELTGFQPGDRVCVHYLATCGKCGPCKRGSEQFCQSGQMIGKYRAGGYAEFILMPAKSIFRLPDEIPLEHGAIMMCSSATALHALNKARFRAGESVAVFGAGGLGLSAIQLARALGAADVFAVDIATAKLELAGQFGARLVNAATKDAVHQLKELTCGRGVDVALELIGLPSTMRQAVRSLAIQGRAALAGITEKSFEIAPYEEVLNKEAEIIGVSDHLAQELPQLLDLARQGKLDLSKIVTRTVPLDPQAINDTLDRLETFTQEGRVVITP